MLIQRQFCPLSLSQEFLKFQHRNFTANKAISSGKIQKKSLLPQIRHIGPRIALTTKKNCSNGLLSGPGPEIGWICSCEPRYYLV